MHRRSPSRRPPPPPSRSSPRVPGRPGTADPPEKADPGDRSVCRRQHHRHHCAGHCRQNGPEHGAEPGGGQPQRRQRHHRAASPRHPPTPPRPTAWVKAPAKNIRTLQAPLAAARARPGSINFASAGQGSATHLNAEKFRLAARIEATNIPFKGSAEAVTEVLSGRVDYYFSPIAPVIGQIRDGQLLALAVGSPKRAAALPEVPTTAEAGVPGSEFNFWIGMMAPAKTPRAIVERLHDEVVKALATPEVKERFLKLGADAWTLKPEQFDAYIKKEIASNAQLVQAAGLQVQQ